MTLHFSPKSQRSLPLTLHRALSKSEGQEPLLVLSCDQLTKVVFPAKGQRPRAPLCPSAPASSNPLRAAASLRGALCRCPLPAWCPRLPRDLAATLCWAEGSGGAPWSWVSASALPLSSVGFSEFGGHLAPTAGWESSVGLAWALEMPVPWGLTCS